jgi:type II secretory pathway pseudopilin PulG
VPSLEKSPNVYMGMPRIAATILCLALAGCRSDAEPSTTQRSEPLTRQDVPVATPDDLPKLDAADYSRTLAEQLDLVPAGADWLVIRDLRPLIAQARTLERVLAGPLTRALPDLIQASEAELAELKANRETLALVLAGLESTGIALDRGAVLSEIGGQPLLLFSANDLQKLGTIVGLVDPSLDLAKGCAPVVGVAGWWACSLGGPTTLAAYQPGRGGGSLLAELETKLPGVELERINVALGVRTREGEPALNLALRTDPGLWELSMPLPQGEGTSMFTTGPTPALRSLLPGAGFVWARVDPSQAGTSAALAVPIDVLTGELFVAPLAEPASLVARVGITDASEAAKFVQELAALLPSQPIEPESMPGTKLVLDRQPIDLDGKLVPAIGFTGSGPRLQALEQVLGLPVRGRLWAYGEYVSLGYGTLDPLPSTLERQRGAGPPAATVAALPPTLARALLEQQVGLAFHVVLDPWQAPLDESELAALAALPEGESIDAATYVQVLTALAPWSSLSAWLQRRSSGEPWIVHATLVPFAAPGPGIDAAEIEATETALATALEGGDAQAAYRDLLARFPNSPRAALWRARIGEAPHSFAAIGTLQLGALATLAVPVLLGYMDSAKASEAVDETQAILAAALAVRERNGNCSRLIGKAGPTPALAVDCNARDGGRCRLGDPGYPATAWTDDPLWAAIGWQPEQGHRFHYAFEGRMDGDDCTLEVVAQGDLDADGTFSTYTRTTTIGPDGSQRSPGLQVVGEGE